MANRATILKQKFQNSIALPFEQVLPEAMMQKVLEEQGVHYRQTLYTPLVVLWAWLSQVLDADKSLSNTVNRVIAWIGAAKARKRLPLAVLKPLLKQTAAALTSKVKLEQWWCGRRVKAYDGTTVLMSDTPVNQKAYPQHSNQKTGCGFPLAKLVVWFCGTTGAVLEVAVAAFNTSEWKLARQVNRPAVKQATHPWGQINQSTAGRFTTFCASPMAPMWIWHSSVVPTPMPCFANIMRVGVIFAKARNWGLATISCNGNVHFSALNR